MEEYFSLVKGDTARKLSRYADLSAARLDSEIRWIAQSLDTVKCSSLLLDTYGGKSFTVSGLGNGGFDAWLLSAADDSSIIYVEAWCITSEPRLYIFMNEISAATQGFIYWMHRQTSNLRYLRNYRNHEEKSIIHV